MTGFRDMSRMKNVWEQTTRYFRRKDSQGLDSKTELQTADVVVSTPFWRKKTTLWIGGAAIVLTAAGLIGYQQYSQYVERNTFEFYHVYMDDVEVGTVGTPDEVEQWIVSKTQEVQQANPDVNMELDTGEITYVSDRAFKAVPDTETTLAKLESTTSSHAVGVEVKIDGNVIGIVKDQETADGILARVQSKYAPELAAKKDGKSVTTLSYDANEETAKSEAAPDLTKPGRVITDVEFVEDVAIAEIETDPASIATAEDIYKKIITGSTKPTKYVVQEGDCVGCIAQKFDITSDFIRQNNTWIKDDKITIGDELDLTVQLPELTVVTTENLVELEKIAVPIEYVKNAKMRVGESKTITQGVEGEQRLTYSIKKENGYVVTEELINKEVLKEPTATVIEKGTMVVLGEGTGRFIWPVSGARLTSKFGSRWGRSHNGIDMIGNKTIKAADNGVVEFVGTKEGLGKCIIINHQNGYKTVYGHLSSYKVSKGDKVEKGDSIGIMGNTGNSTGTHLHFEVHKNGVMQNPLKYL
ncbi:peptidoglycan DD-metalloendopeptidase family protein [Paenibacillus sp. strain BS8-2]